MQMRCKFVHFCYPLYCSNILFERILLRFYLESFYCSLQKLGARAYICLIKVYAYGDLQQERACVLIKQVNIVPVQPQTYTD